MNRLYEVVNVFHFCKVDSFICRLLCAMFFLLLSTNNVLAGSRITATGGINTLEGTAGGGIVPWAVISGYSSSDEWSVTSHYSRVALDDFELYASGFSVSYNNLIEVGYARQKLDVVPLNFAIEQKIYSAKLRLYGDLIYTDWPQISAGMLFKSNQDFTVPQLLGAQEDSSTEYYLAASKLFLNCFGGYNCLTNVTARYSNANQSGLLGFGASGANAKEWNPEISIAWLPSESIAIGVEYREHPEYLDAVEQEPWKDFFVAWFVNKHFSLTAAYVDLGSVAGLDNQTGYYINFQGYF